MRTHYMCSSCQTEKAATEENFHPSSLERMCKNQNRLAIPKCKICAKDYADKYRANLKEKKLTRTRRIPMDLANAKNGVVYIFGSGLAGTPCKIGITSGTDVYTRLSSVQVGNWIKLNVIWTSPYIPRIDRIEKKLHDHFNNNRVSGEWFNLSKKDIKNIPTLIETFLAKA